MKQIETGCKRLFTWAFTLCFGWVLLQTVFANPFYAHYQWYWILPIAALWGVLLFLLWRLVGSAKKLLEEKTILALCVFFVVLTVTQIVFYSLCAGYPTRDFERVFTGAYNYTITGEILDPYLDYFYKYPNNMPLTILLQFVFRVFHKLGVTNFFIIGAICNAVCIDAAYLFTFLAAKKLSDVKTAFFAIGTLFLCLPLQTYISIFYTDTTTMLFAPLIIWLGTVALDSKNIKGALLPLAAMGLLTGLGAKIKYSVIIAFIALCIQFLLRMNLKKLVAAVALVAIGFFGWSFLIDGFMYAHILDKDLAKDRATPFVAWIAMGLQGDGMHDPGDNYYVWARETHEEKVKAAEYLLKARLEEKGPAGLARFLSRKAVRSFGSGDFDYPNTVSDSPMKQNFAILLLNSTCEYYVGYDRTIQGYHVLLFAALVAGGAVSLRKKDDTWFLPQLAAFGMLLFLLLWEAGTRYLLNYYPVFLLCALPGFGAVFSKIQSRFLK